MLDKDFCKKSILIILLGITAYIPLVGGYFIHDEWQTFLDYFLLNKLSFADAIKYLLIPQSGQYNPISVVVAYLIYRFFDLNYYVFLIVGLSLHSIASF